MNNLILAHLSDLHFGHIDYSLKQFLSKKWIGNFNHILFRRKAFTIKDLSILPPFFKSLNLDCLFFTGDFTTTSSDQEFLLAKQFLNQFETSQWVMPGNHDCYTREDEIEGTYYKHFPSEEGFLGYSLQKDRIFCKKIKEGFWGITLDCTVATPPFNAYGVFFPEMEKKLDSLLAIIPKDGKIIIGNHFPLFPSRRPTHDLKNCEALQTVLKKWPQFKLYLHGHDHKPYIIDKRSDGFPLVLNAGSSALVNTGSFYICHFLDSNLAVSHYYYDSEQGWYPEKTLDLLI